VYKHCKKELITIVRKHERIHIDDWHALPRKCNKGKAGQPILFPPKERLATEKKAYADTRTRAREWLASYEKDNCHCPRGMKWWTWWTTLWPEWDACCREMWMWSTATDPDAPK